MNEKDFDDLPKEEQTRLAAKGCWYMILTIGGLSLGLFLGWWNQ